MKIVLLAVNAKYVHTSLAVWSLSAGIARYAPAHMVAVVEATIHQDIDAIAAQILPHKPDLIGISTYIWNAAMLPDLLQALRRFLPNVIFVAGGPEATFNAKTWLLYADYVLCGEGEHSFAMLADALAQGDSLANISGLCYIQGGNVLFNPVLPAPEFLPDPCTDAYLQSLSHRLAYLETSRGCPFSCAFCLSGGSQVRFFPLEQAKQQLKRLSESGVQTVKLVDRTFNCNPERAYALFAYVIELSASCCFHFEVAADLFDDATISLLQSAPPGRIQLEIGMQSFHEKTLQACSRKTDTAKIQKNIKALLKNQNIHIHVDLIAGLPYEELLTFKNSFETAYCLGAHKLQLGFLKLLHGSVLRAQAEKWGILFEKAPPYEIICNTWMSKEDLDILRITENALQRTYNSGRFTRTLQYVLHRSKLHPFNFYYELGLATPNHGMQLEDYATAFYTFSKKLPGVDPLKLRDYMLCDWLGSARGKNLPKILRIPDTRRKLAAKIASEQLGRTLPRCESAVLASEPCAVYVDTTIKNPVTEQYELHFLPL